MLRFASSSRRAQHCKLQVVSPSGAKASNATTVYDPRCGSGSLLLKVGDEASAKVTLYGHPCRFQVHVGASSPGGCQAGGVTLSAQPRRNSVGQMGSTSSAGRNLWVAQYIHPVRSAPLGGVFRMRSRICGRYIWL